MSNLINRGQAALVAWLKAAAAVDGGVTYRRGALTLTGLAAWVGRTAFSRTSSEPGPAVVIGERDYLFAVADLVLGGQPVAPKPGDRVTETIAGVATTFEVVSPETGEPAVRYSDQTRTVWRVHAKRV